MTISLSACLQRLRDLDEAEDVKLVDHLEAMENVKAKIDSYRYVIEQLTLQEEYYERKQAEAQSMADRYRKLAKKCSDRLLWNMQQDGSLELRGHDYLVRITKSERVKLKNEKPSHDDIIKHHDYIKYSWKWDALKIKSDLKAGKAEAQEIAELISCDNLQWRTNNGTTGG